MARRWKAVERRLAQLLGGERVPVTGRQRGYAPDIEHPWLALEVKSWARLPERVAEALDQAEKSAAYAERRQGVRKLPVAIIHADRTRFENSLVVMRLGAADEWFGLTTRLTREPQSRHPTHPSDLSHADRAGLATPQEVVKP